MRVTILLRSFTVGGAENMVYELARHIEKEKAEVSILCYGKREENSLSVMAEKVCPVKYLSLTGEITLASIKTVIHALDELNPDVVHAHMGSVAFASIWSWLRKKGFVATVHTRPDKAFNRKIELLLRLRLLGKKACLVAVSKENALLVKEYFHLPKGKIDNVNNGIDLSKFYESSHDTFTYINVARQDENKNQLMLIKSFANVKKKHEILRLILVGDGPLHAELKDVVKRLGIENSVLFTGNVHDVETYYAQSDVFVLCSYREAMPLSALEAMAAGLPIISSRVGGMVDIVADNGLLLEENTEEALTVAMLRMFDERANLEPLKSASHRIVQSYSAQEMAERYMKIYAHVMR